MSSRQRAARAAFAYYARHRKVIDARLTLNADFFAVPPQRVWNEVLSVE